MLLLCAHGLCVILCAEQPLGLVESSVFPRFEILDIKFGRAAMLRFVLGFALVLSCEAQHAWLRPRVVMPGFLSSPAVRKFTPSASPRLRLAAQQ